MTNMNTSTMAWPISEALVEILQEIVKEKAGACIVNFRDPSYSADRGGFHPVEIMIGSNGSIQYITDFSFSGQPPSADLVKEIDFDFGTGTFQHLGREFPLMSGRSLYRTWEKNFVAYHKMGVFQFT